MGGGTLRRFCHDTKHTCCGELCLCRSYCLAISAQPWFASPSVDSVMQQLTTNEESLSRYPVPLTCSRRIDAGVIGLLAPSKRSLTAWALRAPVTTPRFPCSLDLTHRHRNRLLWHFRKLREPGFATCLWRHSFAVEIRLYQGFRQVRHGILLGVTCAEFLAQVVDLIGIDADEMCSG